MKTTDDQTIEALGAPPSATVYESIAALAAVAEGAACDAAALDILEQAAARTLRERFSFGDESLLADDALQRACRAERSRALDVYGAKQSAAEAALPVLRQRLEARIVRSQDLPGEAASGGASRQERLLGQLVDLMGEREADEWIDKRTPAEVWLRYEAAADDGPERPFVRTVELRHAAKLLDFSASKDPLTTARQFSAGIEARRLARVDQRDLDARLALDALEDRLRRQRLILEGELAKVRPNAGRVVQAVGRVLATAGRGR